MDIKATLNATLPHILLYVECAYKPHGMTYAAQRDKDIGNALVPNKINASIIIIKTLASSQYFMFAIRFKKSLSVIWRKDTKKE